VSLSDTLCRSLSLRMACLVIKPSGFAEKFPSRPAMAGTILLLFQVMDDTSSDNSEPGHQRGGTLVVGAR